MAKPPKPEPFNFAPDDPLAAEHRDVASWVEDAVASLGEDLYYQDVDLKSLASGKKLFDAKREQGRRYVLAAVAQMSHWDRQTAQIRAQAGSKIQSYELDRLPGWRHAWSRRLKAEAVLSALTRRALPLESQDLVSILQWCNATEHLSTYISPIGQIVRALDRYASQASIDPELRGAMRKFAKRLCSSHDKDDVRHGVTVERLSAGELEEQDEDAGSVECRPAPQPALAGSPAVLDQLKRTLEMLPSDEAPSTTLFGLDRFPLRDDSPLREEHELLSALFEEALEPATMYGLNLEKHPAGRALLALEPAALGRALLAATERYVNALLAPVDADGESEIWQAHYVAAEAIAPLAATEFSLTRDGAFDLLLYLSAHPAYQRESTEGATARAMTQLERELASSPASEGERYVLWLYRSPLIPGPPLGRTSEEVSRLTEWIGDGAAFCLAPGEAWSDAVNDDFTGMTPVERRKWAALFTHTLTATSARPSAKWLKTAAKLVEAIGSDDVHQAIERWLPPVSRGQTLRKLGSYTGDLRGAADVMNEENATCLRGLLWLIQGLPRKGELSRLITGVALSAYKKVPGVGPRAVKVGNAAVYALSEMASVDAVGQLAMLKVRVKFGTAQKEIEKAFTKAAEALGLQRDEIEEMGVPSYGLEEIGLRRETLGNYRAELIVTGSNAELRWFDAKEKRLKSVPAKVKSDEKEDLKELRQCLKDVQGMLPAQRDRIDSMFLLEKSWPVNVWQERYLNHPLVGTIARRMLWCVDDTPATFLEGRPADVEGQPVEHGKTAEITLWHPVTRGIEEITAWRERLEELAVTQPFKQAHREVYLLTDAERATNTYSNRFAAHVIRQHQFNALCAVRGWKNKLRLMVDDDYPPASKELPQWGLRAEFWIEGVGDEYGTDTNESGVFLRLATDQVRFYRLEAAGNVAHAGGGGYATEAGGPGQDNVNDPLPLEQVPPLVFSEIMRDVDLFVGVASVGNDPTWQDGGPEGRYRDYWESYAFGELSGTAATRKEVLQRLVPRLKIADRCSFSDRFLIVRGDKRTYKIHLGSGNILMEPNDQYLCIVPDSRARLKEDDLFLPFEGDNALSIVISKALLLADDAKIKDPVILQQIGR